MIYVDNILYKFGRMKMCHMWTDENIDELHWFALKIGLRRDWFQDDKRLPHYDVCKSKRRLAIKSGAVEATLRLGLKNV